MTDTTKFFVDMLKQFDNIIVNEIGDEDAIELWLEIVPDEYTEDDLEFIANDLDLMVTALKVFYQIVKEYS